MCGIVGYIGDKDVVSVLLVGLERLSYRGYDSAGIATLYKGELNVRKEVGKLRSLGAALEVKAIRGDLGLGHTRWATHGVPSQENSHPHVDCSGRIALVHNGIVENYHELRHQLQQEGHIFKSDTDTEVMVHLMERYLGPNNNVKEAFVRMLREVRGSYAIAVISELLPDTILVARQGSPLVVGLGSDENFVSSDVSAMIGHTRSVVFLEDGDIAVITKEKIEFTNFSGATLQKKIQTVEWDQTQVDKGDFDYYMGKEIYEQPSILRNVLSKRLGPGGLINLGDMGAFSNSQLSQVTRFMIQACGTSWHAGLVAKYWFEKYTRTFTEVDISSEFRYRSAVLDPGSLVMAITQSGETADTLAGIREAKSKFLKVLSVCNVEKSSIARESDCTIYTEAGTEVGVASTKAYSSQLAAIYLLVMYMAQVKWTLSPDEVKAKLDDLKTIPSKMEKVLDQDANIKRIAERFAHSKDYLFIGRGFDFPTALEGALKMKEISYIHATGYAAGELKHGPIALIDENMPVVCIATKGFWYEKMVSNVQEVKARRGKIIAVITEGDQEMAALADEVIWVPETPEDLSPMVNVIPLQLLAYHTATKLGCDVDQPRNLAKSVTVE